MFALCFSPCVFCRRPFGYNPHKVPSIRMTPDGPREAMCRDCHAEANRVRADKGLPPWPDPHPDAYEPISDAEL